jgi:LCP family protein required for cell wall assembly
MTPIPRTRASDRRAALAAFLSFLFPGLGQAYNGETRLAWVLATPVVFLVTVVALVVAAAAGSLVTRLFDVSFLVGLIVLDVALLGWRLVAIAQAHVGRQPLDFRRGAAWITGLLLLATLAMHVLPGYYYLAKGIETINSVGLGGRGPDFPGFGGLPEPSDQPDLLRDRVNVLLVGIDSAPYRTQQLTDTMLVVSIDPVTGRSAMISVPRDLYGVPLPDGRLFNAKLNSLMSYANDRPDEFPQGGPGTLKATIGELLGVKIHYFGAINLLGFKQAVDAIGGVDITVERLIDDPTYRDETGQRVGFRIEPGRYHMDGSMALAYVRSRKGVGDDDFTRAARQQQLLTALQEKLTAGNLVLALPALLDSVRNAVATDIPSRLFTGFAHAIQKADVSHLRRIVLQPPEYMTAQISPTAGYILVPDLAAIRSVGEELLGGDRATSRSADRGATAGA